ncbi:MAG TPA: molecular chaperone DnaJ [Candidatus Polarisedimenticolia bacterium]|nr:molecular chaperone DnaJ [Candidatus Polarisedimenticolia bacterium]
MPSTAGKRDYYDVLGVARDATLDQIKSAYRKAALQHHPDRNPGDREAEARFKEAAEAYSVLADPEKRSRYDRFGHDGLAGAGAGFDPGVFTDFEDLFGGLFGEFFGFDRRAAGSRGRAAGRRGHDLRYDLEIDFEEAVVGTEAQVRVPHSEICPACQGLRAASPADVATCQGCRGTGQQRYSQGFFTIARTCGVCQGQGRTIRKPCPECRGAGEVQRETTIKVRIPPGVETGSQLRLAGEGDAGPAGGPRGDLYVFLHVKEHRVFRREGLDVVFTLPLTPTQAALGAQIEFQGIHGAETLRVAPGSQPGSEVRVRGKGASDPSGRGRGDLVARLAVRIPRRLSREGRKILERLAELGDEELLPEDRAVQDRIR